jgi:ATP-dependent Clp protease ATP-binding subunit ClpC
LFERYTESARRALFFARYETSQFGARSIEAEHVLVGILRAGPRVVRDVIAGAQLSIEDVRKQIEGHAPAGERLPTSVELPFSPETKRILQYAAEEADRLLHNYIGIEHLLLAVLREEKSFAASILTSRGITLDSVRRQIPTVQSVQIPQVRATSEPAVHVEFIRMLVDRLARAEPNSVHCQDLLEQLHGELDLLKEHFR